MTSSVDGYPVWQATYLPFGYEYNAQEGANKFKFGTYQRDAESGLDYAEARFYNPQVNRFMTPDPAGTAAANPANPQSWNRYTYVMDNPVTGIDPSGLLCVPGHCPDDPPGGLVLTGDDFDTYRQIGQRTVSHRWVRPPAKPPATAPATPPPSNVPGAPAPAPETDPGPTPDNPAKPPTESGADNGKQQPPTPQKQQPWPYKDPSSCTVYGQGNLLNVVCKNAGTTRYANSVRGCLQTYWDPARGTYSMTQGGPGEF